MTNFEMVNLEEILKQDHPPEVVRTGRVETISNIKYELVYCLIRYIGSHDYAPKWYPSELVNKYHLNAPFTKG